MWIEVEKYLILKKSVSIFVSFIPNLKNNSQKILIFFKPVFTSQTRRSLSFGALKRVNLNEMSVYTVFKEKFKTIDFKFSILI